MKKQRSLYDFRKGVAEKDLTSNPPSREPPCPGEFRNFEGTTIETRVYSEEFIPNQKWESLESESDTD